MARREVVDEFAPRLETVFLLLLEPVGCVGVDGVVIVSATRARSCDDGIHRLGHCIDMLFLLLLLLLLLALAGVENGGVAVLVYEDGLLDLGQQVLEQRVEFGELFGVDRFLSGRRLTQRRLRRSTRGRASVHTARLARRRRRHVLDGQDDLRPCRVILGRRCRGCWLAGHFVKHHHFTMAIRLVNGNGRL